MAKVLPYQKIPARQVMVVLTTWKWAQPGEKRREGDKWVNVSSRRRRSGVHEDSYQDTARNTDVSANLGGAVARKGSTNLTRYKYERGCRKCLDKLGLMVSMERKNVYGSFASAYRCFPD